MPDYKYLVFSGGGSAGVAYAGAIEQLGQEKEFSLAKIEGVAGASVGAIAALMVSLNYSPEEASQKLGSLNLSKLTDGGCLISEGYRLFSKYGMYKGEAIYQFILDIIKEKIKTITPKINAKNLTFADLKKLGFKDLHVVSTKIQLVNGVPTGKLKHFSFETTPDTPIAGVVHASAAAPFFFARVRLLKVAKGRHILHDDGDLYADGGMLNNFPIDIFDKPQYLPVHEHGDVTNIINPHTLGIAMRSKAQIINQENKPVKARIGDNDPLKAFEGVATSFLKNFITEKLDKPGNFNRTIEIDQLGVFSFNFNISDKTKQELIASGKKAVTEFFHPELTQTTEEKKKQKLTM